ncbi:CAP domain-containing protein [Caldanaerobacter sp.]|uniref:CAP domain-containing protein n=1 Tax=Caldanaerobacter sp. TaxID=2930036 RepID=UPI003C7841CE
MNAKSTIAIVLAAISLFSFNSAYASIFYSYGYFSKNNLIRPSALIILKQPASLNKKAVSYTPSLSITNNNTTNSSSTLQVQTNTLLSQEEKTLVELVNKEREKNNLLPLQVDENLCKIARLKAIDMRDNDYFSHISPNYGSPFDMLKKFGINYYMAGENIATNSNVIKAHYSLMNSEGHKANILNSYYNKIGVGVVKNKEGNEIIIVELFIKD